MYVFARKRQRKRLQTERSLTYSYLGAFRSQSRYLGPLIRIGETIIEPGGEFVTFSLPHSELVICVIEGRLEVGTISAPPHELDAGSIYKITAEDAAELNFKNPSSHKQNRVLEIWLSAEFHGELPNPEEAQLNTNRGFFSFLPLASGQGHEEATVLTSECAIYLSRLRPSENLIFETILSRSVCVFVLEGAVRLEEDRLIAGDSALVFNEERIPITAQQQSAVILIDLPLDYGEGD